MADREKAIFKEILILLCRNVILCLQLAGHMALPSVFAVSEKAYLKNMGAFENHSLSL